MLETPNRRLALTLFALLFFIFNTANAQNQSSNQPPGQAAQTGQSEGNANATLNLRDADISTLIATVSQITGKNFVVDPRVKGKVTVISSSPMTAKGVYQAFLSILQVHGYAAIPSGQVIKIVPEVNAKQEGGAKLEKGQGKHELPGDMVTKVIKVNNVPAAQLVPVLRPLVPQYGHLAAYTPTNMLIISDRAANVKRLSNIVQRLDHNQNQNVDVVALKNASAPDLVTTLTKLVQNEQQTKGSSGPQPTIIADERTNSIIVKGDKKQRARIKSLIQELDKPTSATGGTQVIYLKYASAKDLAPVLKGYAKQTSKNAKGAQKAGAGNVSVIPDPDANALVVTAPPAEMRSIRSVVSQLDIRRAQVLVQAVIAEISISKARQLGVDFAAFNPNNIAVASLEQNSPSDLANAASAGSTRNALVGLLKQGANAALGVSSGGTTFAALLNALYSDSKTNVLSTPSLVTLDNQEAKIMVGQEVPFVTGSYTSGGLNTQSGGNVSTTGLVNPFETIQRKNVGIQLDITPQINQGNTVKLKIKQNVSSIASSNVRAADLITNKRTLETTVDVNDGDILVLGGLISDNTRQQQQRVPILGSLPLIGSLFRYESTNKDKRNLMLFVRPVIFRGHGKANYYTRKKYNYIRNIQLQGQGEHVPLMQEEKIPVLEPFSKFHSQGDAQTPTAPERQQGHAGPHKGKDQGNIRTGSNTDPASQTDASSESALQTPPHSIFDTSQNH